MNGPDDHRPEPLPYESKAKPAEPPLRTLACPKCGGAMRQGVLFTEGVSFLQWAAGRVRRAWFGATVPPDGNRFGIITYKCARCGFLESYGRPG